MNEPRVLFVSYSGLFGGSERVLLDVATGLGSDPVVLCPDGPLAERARAAGVRTFAVPQRRLELRASARDRVATPMRLAALATEVRSLARLLRPDVVFGWGTRAATACVAGLSGLDPRPALIFQNNDMLQGPAIAAAARAAARRADLLIAPSRAVARDLCGDSVPCDAKTVVVAPGIDPAGYASDVQRDPNEVLVLGAIVGWKRPRLALEAVALAARELPEINVRIAGPVIDGEGERIMELMRKRAALPDLKGRVELAGPLPDPRAALARAGCLLHCAPCEPFGVVLIEALASGTPVVAPAACGPAEIVDPSCGRHYLPGNAQGAARALIEVLGDPVRAAELGAAGRERVATHFTLKGTRERYAQLLGQLTARRDLPQRDDGDGIAVVTVIHDSAVELEALLGSLDRHMPSAHAIVVDSGSVDGGAEIARRHLGVRTTVIDAGGNVGFGRASNIGVAAADEPLTILINPDVELLDGSLAELAREAGRPGAPERLLAPVLVTSTGGRQDSAQLEPGSPGLAVAALLPPGLLPRALAEQVNPWRADDARAVGWAIAACIAARTDTLKRLGPFDDSIFMYAEDLDLGLRAADAGIETWFWPAARVLHHGAHSTGPAYGGEPFDLLARRRREVVRKWRGPRRQATDDAIQLATFANRLAIKGALGRAPVRERRQIRALVKARRASRP